MKKLSKIALKYQSEKLSESEMKLITGGSYDCFCNSHVAGSAETREGCALLCIQYCSDNPSHC